MLTGGVDGEAPRAGAPSSPRLRSPLQGEREGVPLSQRGTEGSQGDGTAWAEGSAGGLWERSEWIFLLGPPKLPPIPTGDNL